MPTRRAFHAVLAALVLSPTLSPIVVQPAAAQGEPGATPAPTDDREFSVPPLVGQPVTILLPDGSGPAATVTVDAVVDPLPDAGDAGDPGDDARWVAVALTVVPAPGVTPETLDAIPADLALITPDGRLIERVNVRSAPLDGLAPLRERALLSIDLAGVPAGGPASYLFAVPDRVVVAAVVYSGWAPGPAADGSYPPYAGYLTALADAGSSLADAGTASSPVAGAPVAIRDDDGEVLARVTVSHRYDPLSAPGSETRPGSRRIGVAVTVQNEHPDDTYSVTPYDFVLRMAGGLLCDQDGSGGPDGSALPPFFGGVIAPYGSRGGVLTFVVPEGAVATGLSLRPSLPEGSYAYGLVDVGQFFPAEG